MVQPMSEPRRDAPPNTPRPYPVPLDRRGWAVWAGAAVVGGLTLLVFLPALRNGFVDFDDTKNFLTNLSYRGLGWANLRWMFTSAHTGHYIPIAWLTLGMDYVLWGMRPVGYHLTSVVLHAVNAVLFYVLAWRLIALALTPAARHDAEQGRRNPGAMALGASTAALLFSVHPLRVESVAWITERRDLVCGLFSLLTVLAYLRACGWGGPGRLHAAWYWIAAGLFPLALLSKSIVVGLPVALLALDLYPLRRLSFADPARWRRAGRLLVEKWPFLLSSAAITATMLAIAQRREIMTSLDTLGIPERLAVSGYGLIFYLWKTLVPWPLSPLYELHYPVRPLAVRYLLPGIATVAVTVGALVARRRWPAGLAAWVAYGALLLPVLGFTHNGMQIVADRYTYLACLPWALVAGAGVAWCWGPGRSAVTPLLRRLIVGLAATAIAAATALTVLEIRVWHDPETLWRHALAFDSRSALAHHNMGGAARALGRSEEARAEYELALALLPERLANAQAVFHASVGSLLQQQGDFAGAEREYRTALRFSGDNAVALNNLGVICLMRGDRSEALAWFLQALRALPGSSSACVNARQLAAALGVKPREIESCPPAPSALRLSRERRHA
jgi:tetratricopeptide (TPR) repeat protein